MTGTYCKFTRKLTPILLLAACGAAQAADSTPRSGPVVDLRYRHETVDDAAFSKDAQADTLRLRLGYRWVFAPGWQLYADGEHVEPLFGERYNSTANGETSYPVVADPASTEINQAYIGYTSESLSAVLGRQRLQLDNQRFFNNFAWRQNEQTFDAFSLNRSFKSSGTSLRYTWLDQVLRANGHDNPNPLLRAWDLDGHLFNFGQRLPMGNLSGYAYLVENKDRQELSTRTFGVRWNADLEREGFRPGWSVEFARQSDWAENPNSAKVRYRLLESRFSWNGITFKAGQELLGGNGSVGFSTPYASSHAFNGWADRFGSTPVNGLDDRYVGAEGKIGKAAWVVRWHDFRADRGSQDYGREIDASIGYPLHKNLNGLLKLADFRSDGFASDLRKFWVSLDYKY